mmetsp:Transcript_13665/g.38485  ORF Transcript_13665/g.38485 Transcript_13665/m.38485 type:complete len:288 (-) Transcript_13665:535-1398(-)
MEELLCTLQMDSPSRLATERTVSWGNSPRMCIGGMEFVTMTSSNTPLDSLSIAGPLKTGWVAQAMTPLAPWSTRTSAPLVIVPAVSIMSSTITHILPLTSPMMFITSATLCEALLLSMMARGASFRSLAKARALATPPTSGETTTRSSPMSLLARYSRRTGCPNTWSTGMSKYPTHCRLCKSSARTLSAPASVSKLATSLAVMASLPEAFLSALAYPKYGMTAVMFLAEARLQASIMTRSSMSVSFVGGLVDWMRNTSQPLMDSWSWTYVSPSANFLMVMFPSSMPR